MTIAARSEPRETESNLAGSSVPLYINGRFLHQPLNGVNRYATELLLQWDRMLGDSELDAQSAPVVLIPRSRRSNNPFEHIPTRAVGRLSGNLWEQLDLPRAAAGRRLFSPCNSAPWIKASGQVVTIHDASVFAAPDTYRLAYRLKHRILYRRYAGTAATILTVSEFSKRELQRWCHISPDRIEVIYSGCEHILARPPDAGVLQRNNIKERSFVLAMGSHSAHKNVAAVIGLQPVLERLGFHLVIVGGGGPNVFRETRYAQRSGVRWVEPVSDAELRALYEAAALFVFPSLYEGFGFPPLEAMACGCPVVLSDAASLPELGGAQALYCNPRDPESLQNAIEAALSDAALRQRLIEAGLTRARRFNWPACAQQTWRALHR